MKYMILTYGSAAGLRRHGRPGHRPARLDLGGLRGDGGFMTTSTSAYRVGELVGAGAGRPVHTRRVQNGPAARRW